jgi:acyl-homoserine-lactone acylase
MRGTTWRLVTAAAAVLLGNACAPLATVQGSGAAGRPAAGAAARSSAPPAAGAEILWDRWGVPHIAAADDRALFFAFGWAQMESHGNLLLRTYGIARGRAAEYWGKEFLDSDRWVQTNDVPARAERWYRRQSPAMRDDLEAFAAGVDDYAQAHPERLEPAMRRVLPVGAVDVLARIHHLLHFTFLVSAEEVMQQIQQEVAPAPRAGSLGWAVAPSRSAGGHAMLLMNPHLGWDTTEIWYEAQLSAPGVDVYGATLVGMPILAIGFNERLGWTHTVNLLSARTLYRLQVTPGGYRWEGGARPFETEERTLRLRQDDGTLREVPLHIQRSVHGPVIFQRGSEAFALRVAGLEEGGVAEEYWQMAHAHDLTEFEAALARLQIPLFTVLYADRDGHILHLFNGRIPVRASGDWSFWQRIVPGDNAATLWSTTHPYGDLPRVLDPPSGWLQSTNDPPWGTTFPVALDWHRFPPYFSYPPGLGMRQQRSAKLLRDGGRMSLEQLVEAKQSTHSELADRLLADLVAAAERQGGELARRAARVLEAWDRQLAAESRGGVLFAAFYRELLRRRQPGKPIYAVLWQEDEPLATPRGLADPALAVAALQTAAAAVEKQYGRLDVAWGEVNRLQRDGLDLPASGGPSAMGCVRTLEFAPLPDGRMRAVAGETFIAAVEFGAEPRAEALLSYGNASQPGSPHRVDQLPLLARQQLRPVWRRRAEVEAHLEAREVLPAPAAASWKQGPVVRVREGGDHVQRDPLDHRRGGATGGGHPGRVAGGGVQEGARYSPGP